MGLRDIHWRVFANAIDPKVCELIASKFEAERSMQQASVGSHLKGTVDHNVRRGTVAFAEDSDWVNGLLLHYILLANKEIWKFSISDYQSVQYAKYASGDFFDWHKDEFSTEYPNDHESWRGLNRKLTAIACVKRTDDLGGGMLMFRDPWGTQHIVSESNDLGAVIVFPAYLVHKASVVELGSRSSITMWSLGPPFN